MASQLVFLPPDSLPNLRQAWMVVLLAGPKDGGYAAATLSGKPFFAILRAFERKRQAVEYRSELERQCTFAANVAVVQMCTCLVLAKKLADTCSQAYAVSRCVPLLQRLRQECADELGEHAERQQAESQTEAEQLARLAEREKGAMSAKAAEPDVPVPEGAFGKVVIGDRPIVISRVDMGAPAGASSRPGEARPDTNLRFESKEHEIEYLSLEDIARQNYRQNQGKQADERATRISAFFGDDDDDDDKGRGRRPEDAAAGWNVPESLRDRSQACALVQCIVDVAGEPLDEPVIICQGLFPTDAAARDYAQKAIVAGASWNDLGVDCHVIPTCVGGSPYTKPENVVYPDSCSKEAKEYLRGKSQRSAEIQTNLRAMERRIHLEELKKERKIPAAAVEHRPPAPREEDVLFGEPVKLPERPRALKPRPRTDGNSMQALLPVSTGKLNYDQGAIATEERWVLPVRGKRGETKHGQTRSSL